MTANLLWAAMGREPHVFVVIALSVAGALVALALQRYVIIFATAYGGAQTIVVGVAALMGSRAAAQAAARTVYSVYPLNPVPDTATDQIATLVLGTIGILVQLFVTAKGKK